VGGGSQCWTLALIGLVLFALAGGVGNREMLLFGATFTLAGIVRFWAAPLDATPSVMAEPSRLAGVGAQQRFANGGRRITGCSRWSTHPRLCSWA